MSRYLTFAFSFGLWIPAIGIPAGATHGIQASELLSSVVAVWLFAVRFRDRFSRSAILTLLAVLAVAVNWIVVHLVSGEAAQSGPILAYYVAIVLPTLLCGALIFSDEDLSKTFIRGAIAGAVFTSLLCVLQVVLPRELTDLRNNLSFRLPPQQNRSFGAFPEASIAAGMLTFAIAVTIAGLVNRTVREQFLELGWLKGRAWPIALLVLFLVALLSTRSSSVLVMLPVLAAVAFLRFFKGSLGKKVGYALCGGAALALFGAFYYTEIYSVRLENSAAVQSATERLVSVVGAYEMLKDSNFLGAGLGANNNVGAYADRAASDLGLKPTGNIQGVNSFVLGRCLEEGLVMIAIFALVVLRIGRALWRDAGVMSGVLALLGLNALFNALWIAGYRGLLMYWLVIPLAFASQRRATATAALPATRPPQSSPQMLMTKAR